MELFDHFFEQKIKIDTFYPRKLQLPTNGSFLLYGARGVGKSALIIDYLKFTKKRYLYIDADDPVFLFDDIDSDNLNLFIKTEEIELVVIDHYFKGFLRDFPKVEQLILVSRDKDVIKGLPKYQLLPLDYEEFLGFDRFLTPQSAFNHFLRLGTLPKIAKGSIYELSLNLKELFLEKFDSLDSRLLLTLAKFHSRRVSTYQIYTTAREYFKISKDWTYKRVKEFEEEGVIYFFEEALLKGAKKMVIYDFALVKYLNKSVTFNQIFDSTISLALIKHKFEFASFGNLGYIIFDRKRVIIPAAFETKEQLQNKISKLIKELKEFKVRSVAIVTISNRYSFKLDGISFEAIPFYEWTVLNE